MIIGALLTSAVFLSGMMAFAFVIQQRTGKSGWVDTIWSFAVGISGVFLALLPLFSEPMSGRQIAVAILAALWSIRLGGHILLRTLGGGEDPRYESLRQEWGAAFPRRLYWFLQIQAASAFLLAIAIAAAAHRPGPFPSLADFIGLALLLIAIGGEAIADRQLSAFRADPANKGGVCDAGLWGVSRHPNYFFEWLGWLAYAVIAVDPAFGYRFGLLALAGPIFMYWLLVHVSGIPPLEAHMVRSRGDAFRAYQGKVSAFFPIGHLFSRRSS